MYTNQHMVPLILHNKHVQLVYDCSPATATKKISLLRSVLKKKKHQAVTINEFCKYYDLPVKEVIEKLKSA